MSDEAILDRGPYDWYFDTLDAMQQNTPLPELRPQTPECGFFRLTDRQGRFEAVAIYPDPETGQLLAVKHLPNGQIRDIEDPDAIVELFGWCSKAAVPEGQWRAVVEKGEPWPDEPPPPPINHNLSADPLDEILYQLRGEEEELERFLNQGITSEDDGHRAANWKNRIAELWSRADDLRKREKRPHDEAAKAVQERWRPALVLADTLKDRLNAALTAYLREKAKRELQEKAAQAEAGEVISRPKSAKAGTVGRTVALATVKTAQIDDPMALAKWLVDMKHVDLMEELQRIANKVVRAGTTPPGVSIVEEQKAR